AEGAVRVQVFVVDDADSQVSELILKPGEQAISQGEGLSKAAIDVTNALAWTRGDIVFDELELETIVQQLERWYDVDFDRPEQKLQGKLYGKIGRNTNLDEILRVMERSTRYTFKIYETPTGERRVRVSK